jgi:hypothetical protein
MKKLTLILSTFAAISCFADPTNLYLNVSDAEFVRRVNVITNLEASVSNNTAVIASITNTAYSAGPADVWFGSQVISEAFTNAAYAQSDLSAYVGTNVALVGLQFRGLTNTTVCLRTYGDTNAVDNSSMNHVAISAGATANMSCLTDAAGCVDVLATNNTSMTLIYFMRRHDFE